MKYNFGKILKELRCEKEIVQSELGKALNVASNTISSWERGNSEPTIEQIRQIARFFGVSADYILGFEN